MNKMFKHGFNGIHTIYRAKWVSRYTTSATSSNLMVEYLVNSLGFSKQQALLTSLKVSHFKSTKNSISVVDFLKNKGLDQTQIKNIVCRDPTILACSVDKTLKPKIDAFSEIGFCGSDLAHFIYDYRVDFLRRSLNDHIIPTLGLLKSVFGGNDVVISALRKTPWLLESGIKKKLPEVVSLLKSYGLSHDQIRKFALRSPRYLALGSEVLLPVLIRVEERFGIPRGSPMFAHGVCAFSSLTVENLELRMGVYKSFGFSDLDILTVGRKNPYALVISESKLKKCLEYFLGVVGFQPSEIASAPRLLTFSLEKRVIPRYQIWKVLNEKGLRKTQPSLVYTLTVTEPRFFKSFVQPFKYQIPDLYNEYIQRVQSSLEAAE